MKKYGKYEKRPEGVTEKQPKVKSALLQTYLTSLLCMVLCVTMFFGTSYAWFTSEVNNAANEIYIGTLDVGLFKLNGTEQLNLADSNNKLFDSNIRWEPGYTALETIQIVNEGDLAFKYILSFTDGSLATDSLKSLEEVAQYFNVWVYDHLSGSAPTPTSYADITAENSGWENAGSLDQLLSGETVLDGVMVTVGEEGLEATAVNEGTTDDKTAVDTYTIALHMKEEADAAVMGHRISLNVKLVAYQMASEEDVFDSDGYDDITAVSDVKGLKSTLSAGSNVLLTSDVEIENEVDRVTMSGGMLDGNGKDIVYSGERNSSGGSVGVVTTSGGMVSNLTIDGGKNGRALYITKLASDLFVSNCTFSGAYAFNVNSADVTGYTMHFADTTFKSWASYANVMEHAYFTDCTFENVLKPYGDTTLTNCTFTTAGLDVSELANGETVTLVNCTYNGISSVNVVLKAVDGRVEVQEGNAQLAVSDDGVVVVNSNG